MEQAARQLRLRPRVPCRTSHGIHDSNPENSRGRRAEQDRNGAIYCRAVFRFLTRFQGKCLWRRISIGCNLGPEIFNWQPTAQSAASWG